MSMASLTSYRQQLRSIGQSLEAQRIQIFELICRGDRFVVKGEPEKETSMLAALRQWQQRRRSEGLNASLTFTNQAIDQLERQSRALRKQPNRLPDFYSLPNTLICAPLAETSVWASWTPSGVATCRVTGFASDK